MGAVNFNFFSCQAGGGMGVPEISSTGSQFSEILYHSGPFQSSNSFYLAIFTLTLRLLSHLGQSVPSHRDYVPRLSAVQRPSGLNSGSFSSKWPGLFSRDAQCF